MAEVIEKTTELPDVDKLIKEKGFDDHFHEHHEGDKYQSGFISKYIFSMDHKNEGIAPYFRSELTKWLKDILDDDQYRKPDGSKYNLYTDGLKIYTTIDTRVQKYAEKAMYEHMSALQSKYFEVWKGQDFVTYKQIKQK